MKWSLLQKKNLSPLPAGKYGQLTECCTWQRDKPNGGKSGLDADRVPTIGWLRILRSNMMLAAGREQEKHSSTNEEKEKWINDLVDRKTAVAPVRGEDAEIAIKQEQEDMRNAEKAGLTTTYPDTTFDEMMNAIGYSLSDLASSDDVEDGQDEDDDAEALALGKLSGDDEPGLVMGTIPKMVQHRMGRFWQKQMKLDKLTQPGCWDAVDYCHGRDMKYGTTELMVLAVVQPPTEDDATCSVPTTYGQLMESLDRVPGISWMPQVTSRPGSSHMRLRPREPQPQEHIPSI